MRHTRQGLTLIELVVVTAMVASLFVAIGKFVGPTTRSLKNVTRMVKQGREGPAILALIERDLASAYADPRMEDIFEAKESGGGTEMRFVTSRNSQLFVNGVQSALTEVGYRVESNDNEGSVALMTLYRREDYLMDDEPLEGGLWIPVADNVTKFTCNFFALPEREGVEGPEISTMRLGEGDLEMTTRWDKEDRYLPYAVEVILEIDIREGNDRRNEKTEIQGIHTFTSLIRLPPFPRNLPQTDADSMTPIKLNKKPKKGDQTTPHPGDNNGADPPPDNNPDPSGGTGATTNG